MQFEHQTLAQHVSFSAGDGPRDLAAAVHRTGATRAFLIVSRSSAAWADTATARLPIAGRFSEVLAHVPAGLADRARAAARPSPRSASAPRAPRTVGKSCTHPPAAMHDRSEPGSHE